jgi:hypothetical protein
LSGYARLAGSLGQSTLHPAVSPVHKGDSVSSPDTSRPTTKVIGSILLVAGLALAAFSLLADWLDIGGGEGFGYQQMIVLIVGIVLILAGARIVAQPLFNRFGHPQDFAEVER